MTIEPLKELPAPPVKIPPCDIKFITIGLWRSEPWHWSAEQHKSIKAAHLEAEWYVPGTMRIFEVPQC